MTAKRSKDQKQTEMEAPAALPPSALRRVCDPDSFSFKSTNELPDLQAVIGQPRAIRALEMGSELSGPGYNTFVLGVSGSGRTTLSHEYLKRKAESQPTPDDWCYVSDFDDPRCPKALRLPAGRAEELCEDMRTLVKRIQQEISRTFESDEYTQERDRWLNELKGKQEAELVHLEQLAQQFSFAILRTPFGIVLAPAVEGKPLNPEELEKLSEEQRAKLAQLQTQLSAEVDKSLSHLRDLEKNTTEKVHELNERTVLFLLSPLIKALKDKYLGLEQVLKYLQAVQDAIKAHPEYFQRAQETAATDAFAQQAREEWIRRFEVNVLVDHTGQKGAPVILENYPSYSNLLGRIEHEVTMGVSHTDFSQIQPGSLHRANGGYLMIPARDILTNPYAWDGLKRALREGEIRIVELGQQMGLLSTVTLEPEPIPLEVKIVLVGTPMLYYLLRAYDEDFAKLFKVRAEFASTMERTPETEYEYGLFIKSVVDDNHLPAFDRDAVARIIEHSSRMADHQNKLTTRFGKIADLARESAYWANRGASDSRDKPGSAPTKMRKKPTRSGKKPAMVTAEAVNRAIIESIYRSNLVEERIQELFADGTFIVDLSGEQIGQINALSVSMLGDYAFGRPSRVTAVAYAGKGGVVDIERQAKLGGPVHTKGVLILGGLLGARYGRKQSISLSASLTFEQSYDEVEGDSASVAELLALLSAISGIPLRQELAITGSLNQRGQVQAIGGVNDKIEGFYLTCKTKGLTGEQGVIIPLSNLGNLMLRDEVVGAVEAGKFHIWPVHTIEEAILLMTGMEAGELQADGTYPEGTFNHAVMRQLGDFAKAAEPHKDKEANARAAAGVTKDA